ncbi:MAG: CHAT domain-containing protein, partial [Methanosarcinales archaeon]
RRAAEAIGNNFASIPNKELAQNDLHKLTQDKDSVVRRRATEAIGNNFASIPNKELAQNDLHTLIQDKDSYVRRRAAEAIGNNFASIPNKEKAWEDLHTLTRDNDRYVRRISNYAIGRIYILKASESSNEVYFKKNLEEAINYFDKALEEGYYSAEFCCPFYKSYYKVTFPESERALEDIKEEITKARKVVYGSSIKEQLLEVVENLSQALEEAYKTKDKNAMIRDFGSYVKYCVKACVLLERSKEKAPIAVETLRKGLPEINKKIREINIPYLRPDYRLYIKKTETQITQMLEDFLNPSLESDYARNTRKNKCADYILDIMLGLNEDPYLVYWFNINTVSDLGDRLTELYDKEILKEVFEEGRRPYFGITTKWLEIPWELVKCKGEFLFEKYNLYRIFTAKDKISTTYSLKYPIKVLYISDPTGTLEYEFLERYYLEELRDNPALKEFVEFKVEYNMNAEEFKEILKNGEYDIIHYTGHGGYNRETNEYIIKFKDRNITDSEITSLTMEKPPIIVIFNNCTTGYHKDIDYSANKPRGFAQAFIEKGTNSFIGILWQIRDNTASIFSKEFYKDIFLNNLSIADSLLRLKTKYYNDPNYFDIIGYILYSPNPKWKIKE